MVKFEWNSSEIWILRKTEGVLSSLYSWSSDKKSLVIRFKARFLGNPSRQHSSFEFPETAETIICRWIVLSLVYITSFVLYIGAEDGMRAWFELYPGSEMLEHTRWEEQRRSYIAYLPYLSVAGFPANRQWLVPTSTSKAVQRRSRLQSNPAYFQVQNLIVH